MDLWTWVTRAGVVVALLLSVGNTVKLLLDWRRTHREDEKSRAAESREAEAQEQLNWIVELLQDFPEPSFGHGKTVPPEMLPGAELGEKKGVLRYWFEYGKLTVRLKGAHD